MIALLQRVKRASVTISGEVVGAIDGGLAVFVGVERGDTVIRTERMLDRLLGYRVFADGAGKMNLNVRDVNGGLLLIPQFTLAADTRKGMRPSFTPAADPEQGAAVYAQLVSRAAARYGRVQSGRFGAHMEVALVNDGPVTFVLRTGGDG